MVHHFQITSYALRAMQHAMHNLCPSSVAFSLLPFAIIRDRNFTQCFAVALPTHFWHSMWLTSYRFEFDLGFQFSSPGRAGEKSRPQELRRKLPPSSPAPAASIRPSRVISRVISVRRSEASSSPDIRRWAGLVDAHICPFSYMSSRRGWPYRAIHRVALRRNEILTHLILYIGYAAVKRSKEMRG
jgi:hypothetical protein